MDTKPPEVLKNPVNVPYKTLMGPGPSNCSPRVLYAIGRNVLGHMHSEVFQVMDEIKEGLRYVFQTSNELTLAVSAAGHAGMEAVISNLLEPGDKVLIAVNGIWGIRASDMARRYGAEVNTVSVPTGENFSLALLENAIQRVKPKLLFIVQGESSAGVYQPLEGVGDICHRYNCLFAVDTVASLGGVPFFADKWGVDAVYTGSQKVLGAPPGLAPISFSPRAQKVIFERKTPVTVFYWDMTELGRQWNCFNNVRPYHHTTCSNLLFGLREGLAQIVEEGLENVIKRHQLCAQKLYHGLERLGLQPFVEDAHKRLPTVTAISIPENVDWKQVVDYAMKNYYLEISGGLGPTAGKIWRIGLMGYNATPQNVDLVLKVLAEALQEARTKRSSKL
ncbi:serine--pyruvate aminotransferase, mitochondrial [Anoplophora glabripennis]|uniref:serine--pyruvate aminotransferase, mitochondrial n=1 Tax=Anoplophora glabripennis TaxID=217634 RepID=UPI000874FE9E|nr:serine--pyruvate aminotransferase, mitochondrial [Anoplophora glabripennis]